MAQSALAHTDIRAEGWVMRLPYRLRLYALLARLDRPVGTWLLLLPGVWGIGLGAPADFRRQVFLIVLFAIGSLVMRSAGCVINDIWDREIDSQVARTAGRPLASGALPVSRALAFLALLLLTGAGILACLPPLCWALAPLAMVLVTLYPLAKRVTWWPQLVMGFTFGFGAPMGYAAGARQIDETALLLYAGTILWQLGFDTIYGFQDMEDDARIGVRSTSRLMASRAKVFVALCYAGAAAFLAVSAVTAHQGPGFWLVALIPAAMLARQVMRLDAGNPGLCLTLFKNNVFVGQVIAVALLAGNLTRG